MADRQAKKIVAGLASVPARQHILGKVIASIKSQVDEVHVFLNGYEDVPAYLFDRKIHVYRSQVLGDHNDVGKFYALSLIDDAILFALDDDIIYPLDYVKRMMCVLDQFKWKCVVGVHGCNYPRYPQSFFDRKPWPFWRPCPAIVPVSLLGTGTIAFDVKSVGITLQDFTSHGMADIHFASYLKRRKIPAFMIDRPENWLVDTTKEQSPLATTLYERTRLDSGSHNELLRHAAPWGDMDILDRVTSSGALDVVEGVTKLALLAVKEALNLSTEKNFFRKRADIHLKQPFLEAHEIFAFLADWETSERAYINVLEHLGRHKVVRDIALEGLWTTSKREAFKASQRVVTAPDCESEDQVRHAKYARALFMHDDALVALNNALSGLRNRRLLDRERNDILLEMLGIYGLRADFDNVLLLSEYLDKSCENNPRYLRELFIAEAASGVGGAGATLERFFRCKNRRHAFHRKYILNRLYELQNSIKDHARDSCSTFVTRSAIINVSNDVDRLRDLAKIAVLLGEDAAVSICEGQLLLSHAEWCERNPEFMLYLRSNRSFVSALETAAFPELGITPGGIAENALSFFFERSGGTAGAGQISNPEKISVIMTAFNSEATIRYAIDSVLNQTVSNLELIVIDDSSTDGTTALVNEMAYLDSRVTLITGKENLGPYACRNIGLERCTGTFVAMQDADDLSFPVRLERQLAAFKPGVVAVLSRHIRVNAFGRIQLENNGEVVGDGPVTLLFKRSVVDDVGGFAPVRTRGDMEFQSRLEHAYGVHALVRLDTPLLYALHDMGSNSHEMSKSFEMKRNLIYFREDYVRRHRYLKFGPGGAAREGRLRAALYDDPGGHGPEPREDAPALIAQAVALSETA